MLYTSCDSLILSVITTIAFITHLYFLSFFSFRSFIPLSSHAVRVTCCTESLHTEQMTREANWISLTQLGYTSERCKYRCTCTGPHLHPHRHPHLPAHLHPAIPSKLQQTPSNYPGLAKLIIFNHIIKIKVCLRAHTHPYWQLIRRNAARFETQLIPLEERT